MRFKLLARSAYALCLMPSSLLLSASIFPLFPVMLLSKYALFYVFPSKISFNWDFLLTFLYLEGISSSLVRVAYYI